LVLTILRGTSLASIKSFNSVVVTSTFLEIAITIVGVNSTGSCLGISVSGQVVWAPLASFWSEANNCWVVAVLLLSNSPSCLLDTVISTFDVNIGQLIVPKIQVRQDSLMVGGSLVGRAFTNSSLGLTLAIVWSWTVSWAISTSHSVTIVIKFTDESVDVSWWDHNSSYLTKAAYS